jgi:molecular chaperone GrpE
VRWPPGSEARRRLVEALLDWVGALEEAEPLPEGVDPSGPAEIPDLYAALSHLESLRREVSLQGRTFSKLAESTGKVSESLEGLAREEDADRGLEEARAAGRREVLVRLLEAREGMARSLRASREVEPHVRAGPFAARRRREAFASLRRALEMNLEAVDEALRDLDVREIVSEGAAFDPECMRAVEAADRAEGPPGTVVAVIRPGWRDGHRVLRAAEVRAVPGEVRKE